MLRSTESVEDYLKAVYALQTTGAEATISHIADRLGVSAPSVSAMVKRLWEHGLVCQGEHRDVVLTEEGERQALAVVRRHRLLETYLHRELGLHWDEVHDEAERLEHVLSERVEEAIDRRLGHPTHDPHGDPIPVRGGAHSEGWTDPLDGVEAGHCVRVDRVSDREPEALRYLAELGVVPGAEVRVDRREPFGGPIWLSIGDEPHALGPDLAGSVFVSPVRGRNGSGRP